MVDNYDRKDVPGSGVEPSHPDVGGSITIDSSGHVRKIEVDVHVPGTADGSKPAHWEHSDDPSHPDHKQPWTPDMHDPHEPVYNPLPVQPGWVRDPATGLDHPDFSGHPTSDGVQGVEEAPSSEMGDFPTPSGDEMPA
jgi:hypothetical protein